MKLIDYMYFKLLHDFVTTKEQSEWILTKMIVRHGKKDNYSVQDFKKQHFDFTSKHKSYETFIKNNCSVRGARCHCIISTVRKRAERCEHLTGLLVIFLLKTKQSMNRK